MFNDAFVDSGEVRIAMRRAVPEPIALLDITPRRARKHLTSSMATLRLVAKPTNQAKARSAKILHTAHSLGRTIPFCA